MRWGTEEERDTTVWGEEEEEEEEVVSFTEKKICKLERQVGNGRGEKGKRRRGRERGEKGKGGSDEYFRKEGRRKGKGNGLGAWETVFK